jgi:hypothetical protein
MGFSVQSSPEIWSRDDLPMLCFWRKLYRCVEVGVDRAEWASLFLSRFPQCQRWWGIDAYAPYPEQNFPRDADYMMAAMRLERFGEKAKLIRLPSVEAAKLFAPGSVDFVYVDAAHDYESVRGDIAAWWPAISREGILAGHDFDNHELHAGVKQAVTAFAQQTGLTVYLTAVGGYRQESEPSWMIYKTGMPGSEWRRC